MKNFTKLFALGLLAISTGISSAQTYTATAGAGGTTDIASDYSMSTGDGASVSVDVPLEFELGKIVAVTVSPSGTATVPSSSYFDGIIPYGNGAYISSKVLDLTPMAGGWFNSSVGSVGFVGGIYANTSVTVSAESTDFVHESDPNSTFKPRKSFLVGKKVAGTSDYRTYGGWGDGNASTNPNTPISVTLDDSAIQAEGGKFSYLYYSNAYIDTVDSTDRAGKYISITTITVSTL